MKAEAIGLFLLSFAFGWFLSDSIMARRELKGNKQKLIQMEVKAISLGYGKYDHSSSNALPPFVWITNDCVWGLENKQ